MEMPPRSVNVTKILQKGKFYSVFRASLLSAVNNQPKEAHFGVANSALL